MVCKDGFTLINNKCLMLLPIYQRPMWSSQLVCNRLGGNIVSIRTAIDNTAIAKILMATGYLQGIWIGLTCYNNNDPASCIWHDQLGNASSYNNFQAGNPELSTGNCVYLLPSTGKWVSASCNDNSNLVCETDLIDECSHKFGDNCYYPLIGNLYNYEALNICEQMCSGSLVSIHSAAENSYISGFFLDPNITSIHIGAMLSPDGRNYWTDGTTLDFANFGHSNENSGFDYNMAISSGKWNSQNNRQQLPSICKWKANSTCQTTCTEPIFREETGTILSPSYPFSNNVYRGNSPCYYVLHVPSYAAAIWFNPIFLDSNSSIELYSDTGNSTPIAVITQENQDDYKKSFTSPSRLIKLVFNPCIDNCNITQNILWFAQFGTNYGSECGQTFNTNAVISSQNYPNNYPNNYKCTYYIQNPGGFIYFRFDHFETEKNRDYVKIYNHETGELLWSFSGSDVSGFYSADSPLKIEFTTDKSNTFSGWSARFMSNY